MPSKQDSTQPSYVQLEQEVTKTVYALATRNAQVGDAIIASLCDRLPLEAVAGIILVTLEQLLWLDAEAFAWTVNDLLPTEILSEMRRITAVVVGKRLVDYGFVPGQDFSVDATGKLLLNDGARKMLVGS